MNVSNASPSTASLQAQQARFQSADTHGDGVVSMAELLQSLSDPADTLGSNVSSETGDLLRKLLAQLSSALIQTDPVAKATATEFTA